ncbi:MAG: cell cycle transcriptional regulator TrcR, partial [Pseudomonadota bacterium]
MADILMPKATAVWLIDNTALTFDQIAEFCGLHHLEVKGIADGDVAENMRGVDPIAGGELMREEITKAEADSNYRMEVAPSKIAHIPQPKRKGARYTPVARRQDKPDAIAWFIRNHPEVTDAQIGKLIGTTKSTITNVRERTHWNSQ